MEGREQKDFVFVGGNNISDNGECAFHNCKQDDGSDRAVINNYNYNNNSDHNNDGNICYDDKNDSNNNCHKCDGEAGEGALPFLHISASRDAETQRSLAMLRGLSLLEMQGNVLAAAYNSGGFAVFSVNFSDFCHLHLMAAINRIENRSSSTTETAKEGRGGGGRCGGGIEDEGEIDPAKIVTALKIDANRKYLAVGHLNGNIAVFSITSGVSSPAFIAISLEGEYRAHMCEIATTLIIDDTVISLDSNGMLLEYNIWHLSANKNEIKPKGKKKKSANNSVLDFTLSFLDLTKTLNNIAKVEEKDSDGEYSRDEIADECTDKKATRMICQLNKYAHKVVAAKSSSSDRSVCQHLVLLSINDAAVLFKKPCSFDDQLDVGDADHPTMAWSPVDIDTGPIKKGVYACPRGNESNVVGKTTILLTVLFQYDPIDTAVAVGVVGLKTVSSLNASTANCTDSNQITLSAYFWDLQGNILRSISLSQTFTRSLSGLETDDDGEVLVEVLVDMLPVSGKSGDSSQTTSFVGISNYFRYFPISVSNFEPFSDGMTNDIAAVAAVYDKLPIYLASAHNEDKLLLAIKDASDNVDIVAFNITPNEAKYQNSIDSSSDHGKCETAASDTSEVSKSIPSDSEDIFVDSSDDVKASWLELYWEAEQIGLGIVGDCDTTVGSRLKAHRSAIHSSIGNTNGDKYSILYNNDNFNCKGVSGKRCVADVCSVASFPDLFASDINALGDFDPPNSFSLELEFESSSNGNSSGNSSNISSSSNSSTHCRSDEIRFDRDLGVVLVYNSLGRLEVASFPAERAAAEAPGTLVPVIPFEVTPSGEAYACSDDFQWAIRRGLASIPSGSNEDRTFKNVDLNIGSEITPEGMMRRDASFSRSNLRQLVKIGDVLIALDNISIRNKNGTFISNLLEKLNTKNKNNYNNKTIKLTFEFGNLNNSDHYRDAYTEGNHRMRQENFNLYMEKSVSALPFLSSFLDFLDLRDQNAYSNKNKTIESSTTSLRLRGNYSSSTSSSSSNYSKNIYDDENNNSVASNNSIEIDDIMYDKADIRRTGMLIYREDAIRSRLSAWADERFRLKKALHACDNSRQNVFISKGESRSFRDAILEDDISVVGDSEVASVSPYRSKTLLSSSPTPLFKLSFLVGREEGVKSESANQIDGPIADPVFGNISNEAYLDYSASFCKSLAERCKDSGDTRSMYQKSTPASFYRTSSSNSRSSSSPAYNTDSESYEVEYDELIRELLLLRAEYTSNLKYRDIFDKTRIHQSHALIDLISRNDFLSPYIPPISATLKLKRFICKNSVFIKDLSGTESGASRSRNYGSASLRAVKLPTISLLDLWIGLFEPPSIHDVNLNSYDTSEMSSFIFASLDTISTHLAPFSVVIMDLVTLYVALKTVHVAVKEGENLFHQIICNSGGSNNSQMKNGDNYGFFTTNDRLVLSALNYTKSNIGLHDDDDKDDDDGTNVEYNEDIANESEDYKTIFPGQLSLIDKFRIKTLALPTLNTMLLYAASDYVPSIAASSASARERNSAVSNEWSSCFAHEMASESARAADSFTSQLITKYFHYARADTLFALFGSLSCNFCVTNVSEEPSCKSFMFNPFCSNLAALYSLTESCRIHQLFHENAFKNNGDAATPVDKEDSNSNSSNNNNSDLQTEIVVPLMPKASSKIINANEFLDNFLTTWPKQDVSKVAMQRSTSINFSGMKSCCEVSMDLAINMRRCNTRLIGLVRQLGKLFAQGREQRLVCDVCVNLFPLITTNHYLFIMGLTIDNKDAGKIQTKNNRINKSNTQPVPPPVYRVINIPFESRMCDNASQASYQSYLAKLLRKQCATSLDFQTSRSRAHGDVRMCNPDYARACSLTRDTLTSALLSFLDLSLYLMDCYSSSSSSSSGDRSSRDGNSDTKRNAIVSSLREIVTLPNTILYRNISPVEFAAFCASICRLVSRNCDNNTVNDKAPSPRGSGMLFTLAEVLVIVIKNYLAAQEHLHTSMPRQTTQDLLGLVTQHILVSSIECIYSESFPYSSVKVDGPEADSSFQILNYHANIVSQALRVIYIIYSILKCHNTEVDSGLVKNFEVGQIAYQINKILQSIYSDGDCNSCRQVSSYCIAKALIAALGGDLGQTVVDGCPLLYGHLTAMYYRNRK